MQCLLVIGQCFSEFTQQKIDPPDVAQGVAFSPLEMSLAVQIKRVLILLEGVFVIAPFIEHEAKIVSGRSLQLFVTYSGGNLDRVFQMLYSRRIIRLLPVNQA